MRWFNLNEEMEMEGERGRSRGGFLRASARLGSGDRGGWRSRRRRPWFLYGHPLWYSPVPTYVPQVEPPPEEDDGLEYMTKSTKGWKSLFKKRPSFTKNVKKIAYYRHNQKKGGFKVDEAKPNLPLNNAAMPHRKAYKHIRNNTRKFVEGKETKADFKRWTGRFIDAGQEKIDQTHDKHLQKLMQVSQKNFIDSRNELIKKTKDPNTIGAFLNQANSFHANVPDLGPHKGVNNPVGERMHLNVVPQGPQATGGGAKQLTLSPMSKSAVQSSPGRFGAIAVDKNGHFIGTDGKTYPLDGFSLDDRQRLAGHPKSIVKGYDPNAPFGPTGGPGQKSKHKNHQK